MKKTFILSFVILSIFFFSCASTKNVKLVSKNLVGKWEFQTLKVDDESSKDAISNIMQNSVLEFTNDKSFSLKITGLDRNGVWALGQKGRALLLGYEKTKNSNRLKSFDIISISETEFVWNYFYGGKNLELTYKRIK